MAPAGRRRLSHDQAEEARRRAARYADREVVLGGTVFALRPCAPPAGAPPGAWQGWSGRLGDEHFVAWISPDAIGAMARRAGLDLGSAPDDGLLVRAAEWLAASVAGDSVRLDEPRRRLPFPIEGDETGLFAFCLPDCGATLALRASPSLRRRLEELLEAWPRARAAADELLGRIACVVGQARLTVRVLAAVCPGDVIEIDGPPAEPDHVFLVAGGHLVARAARHHSGWQVVSGFSEPPVFSPERTLIVDPLDESVRADGPAEAGLGDLPVLLTFEIGRAELPLSRLTEIGAGHVFDLGGDPDRVDILSAGRRIGTGRIVEVAGRSAVQVERILP
jgi:type III secretion system YscQ/HrcQ family protein